MSSSSVAIHVDDVSKRYELYDTPLDRLKQFILPKLPGVRGPRRYFKEFWALRNVSLTVHQGEAVAIVGRNGSGKSTLLQVITGTLAPTSGQVTTAGRVAALLELGSGFNPDFSGRENVFMNAALLGLDSESVARKFDAIASFADVGPHLDQPVKTYSSGMLLRLAFAVQVQVDPDILIVDEALAVGDALFQKRCLRKLASLVERGTTLLFVSHSQETVRTLTTRALLLDHGFAIAQGGTATVLLEYRRRQNIEEAAYLGAAVRDVAARARGTGASQTNGKGATARQVSNDHLVVDMDSPSEKSDMALNGALIQARAPDDVSPSRDFGNRSVEVVSVDVMDAAGVACAVFSPGDAVAVRVHCRANVDATRLNVAIRILNKEGVKIYSWGTLNQDMSTRALGAGDRLFWSKEIHAGELFDVSMDFLCALGSNLYEIQASVSLEDTPDYMSQHILHWVDEAAFFQVVVKRDEHFFGGVVDLRMKASW